MNRLVTATLGLMLLAGCSVSSRISYLAPASQAGAIPKVDVGSYEKKYPGKDGVYLDLDDTVEHVTMLSYIGNFSEWTVYETTRRSYLVLNKDADWLSTFTVQVQSGSELEAVELSIQSPDGSLKSFGKSDLRVQTDSDQKTVYKLLYPNVMKGSVITESFVLKRSSNIRSASNIDRALQFNIPCEKVSFKFMYPSSWEVRLKQLAPGKELPVSTTRDDKANKTIVIYQGKDVPAVEKEIYAPFFKEVSSYFRLMVTRGWGSPAFSSWDDFGRQFSHYAVSKSPIFSQRVETTTKDLIKNASTPQERLEAIVEFVQDNIEIGSRPYEDNFADTLAKKKGNWYQVTGLTQSMLDKAGIDSTYLLIHSADDGFFDPGFISFDEVYLPALSVSMADRHMIVLPYAKRMPVNHIPETMQGRPALQINRDGKATFTTTPHGSASNNTTEESYKVSLSQDGILSIQEEKVLTGTNAFRARRSLENLKKNEMEKVLKGMLTYTEGNVVFKKYEFEHLDEFKKPLKIKLEYTIDNLLTVTPDEIVFNTGGLFSPSSNLKTKVATEERQQPVRIYNDELTVKRVKVSFPEAWTLVDVPSGFKVENAFGSVESAIRTEGQSLHVQQSLQLRKAEAPKDKFSELLDLIGRRSRLNLKSMVFKVKG